MVVVDELKIESHFEHLWCKISGSDYIDDFSAYFSVDVVLKR